MAHWLAGKFLVSAHDFGVIQTLAEKWSAFLEPPASLRKPEELSNFFSLAILGKVHLIRGPIILLGTRLSDHPFSSSEPLDQYLFVCLCSLAPHWSMFCIIQCGLICDTCSYFNSCGAWWMLRTCAGMIGPNVSWLSWWKKPVCMCLDSGRI